MPGGGECSLHRGFTRLKFLSQSCDFQGGATLNSSDDERGAFSCKSREAVDTPTNPKSLDGAFLAPK